jgi:hypothetical protein
MNKHLISNELQVRVRKRWREELSGEERRALLIEKENKKRREEKELVEEIPLTTTSSTTTSTTSLHEKIIKTDKDVCDTILPIPSIPLIPIETKKTARILHRSATIAVAPIEMYVEENDRTKTTRNAYRVASLKSITTGGIRDTTAGGGGGGVGIGGHSYKETERRQSIRYGPGYIGHTCAMCGAFYSALATSALAATSVGSATAIGAIDARRMCNCASRHRSKFEQDPPTPPDFWDLDDDDWTERIRR